MKLFKHIINVLCASAFVFSVNAQYKIEVLDTNTFTLGEGVVLHKTSFRGLSVVDDQTIWVSGSRGTIAKSVDGGKTFTYSQLKGYEKSDFRDIEAFDDKRAIIMSSGTPAYILKTIDGGQTWKEVYKNTDTAYFLDAMDFWDDKRGMLVGDPINGHFVLLQTIDGGETWQELDTTKTPEAIEGEAVFAASGTSLTCSDENRCTFVSGGIVSRVFNSNSIKRKWSREFSGLSAGNYAKGAFSLIRDNYKMIIVGGDYMNDTLVVNNSTIVNYTDMITSLKNDVNGYRSCIEDIRRGYIACGTSGVDFTIDGWSKISSEPFHVVRKAKKGKAVFLAGPKGKIGKLVY